MPKDPTGRIVNNAVQTNRFANGVSREMAVLINDAGVDVEAMLRRRGVRLGPKRTQALNRQVNDRLNVLYRDMRPLLRTSLVGLGQVEERFALGQLESMLTGVGVDITTTRLTPELWRSIVNTEIIQGHTTTDWWTRQSQNTKFHVRRQVQLGLAQQETVDQIVRRVRGRSVGRGRFSGGVVGWESQATRQATALVRTAVTQIQARAHLEAYSANDDVTTEYEYVATLDDRTTVICASLDHKVYKYNEGPLPPQHYNCRSTIVPIVDWEGLGVEPPAPGKRAATGGPVTSEMNYSTWLKDQPITTQNEVLGVGKAKMFRDGKVTLGQLVKSDNSIVTLEQLEKSVL